MMEAGVPGLGISAWIGLFTPAGTPQPVVVKLQKAITDSAEEMKAKLTAIGGEYISVDYDKIDAFVSSEFEIWSSIIKDANIKLDEVADS